MSIVSFSVVSEIAMVPGQRVQDTDLDWAIDSESRKAAACQ